MNKKGFFVSLTSLLILIVLISLVLVDQTLSRERAEGEWDETRKELVSELVFDLENAMIPNAISSSVKKYLVSESHNTNSIDIDNIIINLNNNFLMLNNDIQSIFTIPLETPTITVNSLDITQFDAYTLLVTTNIYYEVKSEGDSWSNTVEYENLPISVIGMIHPAYPDNGAITPDFWKVWGDECVVAILGQSCHLNHGICPIKDLVCDTEGELAPEPEEPEEDPVEEP